MEMTQQFVAVGADEFGNRISGLTFAWSVENGGGAIDSEGLFTAGIEPDSYKETVKVTVTQGDLTVSSGADVTVEPDRLAFVSDRFDSDQWDIHVMDADGKDERKISEVGEGLFPNLS